MNANVLTDSLAWYYVMVLIVTRFKKTWSQKNMYGVK